MTGIAKQLAGDLNFLQNGFQIRLQKLGFLPYGAADKAAIGAPGGAEGDAHIHGQIPRGQYLHGPDGGLGAFHSQLPPLRGDEIYIPQQLVGGFRGASLQQVLGGQLGGANPSQSAPGRLLRQQRNGGQIDALL